MATPAEKKYCCYYPHPPRDSVSPVSGIFLFYYFLIFFLPPGCQRNVTWMDSLWGHLTEHLWHKYGTVDQNPANSIYVFILYTKSIFKSELKLIYIHIMSEPEPSLAQKYHFFQSPTPFWDNATMSLITNKQFLCNIYLS